MKLLLFKNRHIFLLSIILMATNINYAQQFNSCLSVEGSFVIAAICKDGIIIASDSRANIFDKRNQLQEPIAYFDSIQKIYPIGINAIAETGQGLILNLFFSAIIKSYKANTVSLTIENLLPSFINYCKNNYPPELFREMRKQKLFATGYIGTMPTICYYNEDQPTGSFGCIQKSGFIESDSTLLYEYRNQLDKMSSDEVADLAIKAINDYAKNNDNWKTIGGQINVLLVTPQGTKWVKNMPPPQRWTYIQDFIGDFINGDVKINLIEPTTIEQLKNLFLSVPKK
ncbi:MAG: hypothetical protein M1480_12240 [Bacteroidetes bacterium]|nr:hypothetical protein [Bacteroidota bacterium]